MRGRVESGDLLDPEGDIRSHLRRHGHQLPHAPAGGDRGLRVDGARLGAGLHVPLRVPGKSHAAVPEIRLRPAPRKGHPGLLRREQRPVSFRPQQRRQRHRAGLRPDAAERHPGGHHLRGRPGADAVVQPAADPDRHRLLPAAHRGLNRPGRQGGQGGEAGLRPKGELHRHAQGRALGLRGGQELQGGEKHHRHP